MVTEAVVEKVSAMPGQGVSGMFRFGTSYGIVLGVLGALEIPTRLVTPGRWKADAGLLKKDKDVSRLKAIEEFPAMAGYLVRKKDVGRADAIWIARWGLSGR